MNNDRPITIPDLTPEQIEAMRQAARKRVAEWRSKGHIYRPDFQDRKDKKK